MIEAFDKILPSLGSGAWAHDSAVIIGDVTLGDECSVWPNCTLRGDVNKIRIGDRTNIQDGSVFHVESASDQHPDGFPLIIGNSVTIGHKVLLHGCSIGDRCLIGMGAIILDGAVLEDKVFVAAGSLVTPGKRLESGKLYRGQPARPVRELNAEEIAYFEKSAQRYIELKNAYL
ncbi:MAG: gamma carbonic anhydrase family protein [Gammaproteobacteria bacterium]|nr:gamma carbonic anhydrase family protein [Gammaproteobacteria bacterium]